MGRDGRFNPRTSRETFHAVTTLFGREVGDSIKETSRETFYAITMLFGREVGFNQTNSRETFYAITHAHTVKLNKQPATPHSYLA